MRKIYIIGIAALAAGSIMAAPSLPSFVSKAKKAYKTEQKRSFKKEKGWRAEAVDPLWRPATQYVSEWNPETENWEEASKYITTYDNAGRILSDEIVSILEGGSTLTTYVYDENGMPLSKLVQISEDGTDFANYTNTVRVYDPVVHSCIISNTESIWMNDAWQEAGNCYRRDITRNADGNVTEVVIRTLYEGNYEASQKMTVEYGPDGKATGILTSVLTYNDNGELEWQPEMEYKDIVWHHTNGQIISADDTTTPENGIASCTVFDTDGENHVTVEYPDDKGSFISKLVYDMGELEVNMKVLDEYGSYDYSQTEVYREEGEPDYSYTSVERYRMNEYGLETEVYAGEAEGDGELMTMAWMKGEIEADPEYGYPVLFTVTEYNPDEDVFNNMMQIRFADYKDVSGIEAVDTDNSAAPVEYYNLQGMRMHEEPASGIYIRRQGTQTVKILK